MTHFYLFAIKFRSLGPHTWNDMSQANNVRYGLWSALSSIYEFDGMICQTRRQA